MAGIDDYKTVLETDERDAVLSDRPGLVGRVESRVDRREPRRLEGEELPGGRRDRRHFLRIAFFLFAFRRRPLSPSRSG